MAPRLVRGTLVLSAALLALECGGSSPAAPGQTSNPGGSSNSCTYSLGSGAASVNGEGGTGSIALTTGANCAWTASSQASWLAITSSTNGAGNATISYTVGSNPTLASRTGTLTIGGQTLTITQAAATSVACTQTTSADALGGLPFFTFLDPIAYGCRIVNVGDGHPVHDGVLSARFELRANECNSSSSSPDCQTDRSRYEIFDNMRGVSTDGRIVSYEEWIYVPPQARFRPRGGNIMFVNQIQYLPTENELGGVLAFLEVGPNLELMVRTHRGFTFDIDRQHTVATNLVGTWTKIVWEIKSTTQGDGYIRVYVNDVLKVDETKPTLPTPGWRHSLKIGIYNAFRSNAVEPFDTQVVYFDGIVKSVR